MNVKFIGKLWIAALVFTLAINCATVEKKIVSEKDFVITNDILVKESVFSIRKDKKGKVWGELKSKFIYAYTYKGDVDETDDKIVFKIRSLYVFSHTSEGFSEAEIEAAGLVNFVREKDKFRAKVIETPEIGDVISAEIKYRGTYIPGEKAIAQIKNRMERIVAVNEFLKSTKKFDDHFPNPIVYKGKEKTYNIIMRYFLFPEIFSDSVLNKKSDTIKDSSDDYKIRDYKKDAVLNEEVLWNKKYTEKVFPIHLREVRNSGVMYRDFNEAFTVFYSDYNNAYYFEKVLNNSEFFIDLKK